MQSFAVTPASSDITLDATRNADASFTVTNNTALEIRGRGDVVPQGQTQKAWFALEGESVRGFQPGGTEQYQIHVAVPPTVAAGTYTFQMLMASEANPDEDSTLSSVVSLKVADAPPPKRKIPWLIIIVAAIVLIGAIVVFLLLKGGGAKTVFGPDPFDAPSQFSPNLIVTAPSQEKFLGTPNASGFSQGFSNDLATLSLQNLPKHTEVTVTFDLYVISSWDGNRGDGVGPDFWAFGTLEGGVKRPVVQTTFSNTQDIAATATQCFPDNCQPGGQAVTRQQGDGGSIKDLGFPSQFSPPFPTRVYQITRTIPQSDTNLTLYFAGGTEAGGILALQGAADEAWGLDNVEVQVK